ncbi:MAG: DNA cytosine methyltransferase [Glycocaulis sp.]
MRELIIDSFAGGGGASVGIEMALGRSPDVAINHDADAIRMHTVNHPSTAHLNSNIYHVDPRAVRPGEPIGLFWASPDCTHHSKAKGGKPIRFEGQNSRDLAWVIVQWATYRRPRVIAMENVEEWKDWGPLIACADGKLRPCPERKGRTFERWKAALRKLGYRIEMRELRGCDYGAPTIRKRLFVIARCDGEPIVWPEPTHGAPDDPDVIAGRKKPWRTAAEIIDWSLPCPSIFLTPEEAKAYTAATGTRLIRPLAGNTMARIARGVKRYVLDNPAPFLISVAHGDSGGRREYKLSEPIGTATVRGVQHALVAPVVTYAQQGGATRSASVPLHTICASRKDQNAVIAAFLAQHNGGERMETHAGRPADAPISTITTRATQQNVVAAHLINMKGSDRRASAASEPLRTITAQGGGPGIVAAFMAKYYGQGEGQAADEPLHTITTRDRFGLVTVQIGGEPWVIVDIGMRMLTPRELFTAQGFALSYRIDADADGLPFTKSVQTRCVGNSVCPDIAAAIVRANVTLRDVELPVAEGDAPLFEGAA